MHRDKVNAQVPLTKFNVDALFFDKKAHFAGIRYVKTDTDEIFTDLSMDIDQLHEEKNNELFYMEKG
jgi:hypothetical protein